MTITDISRVKLNTHNVLVGTQQTVYGVIMEESDYSDRMRRIDPEDLVGNLVNETTGGALNTDHVAGYRHHIWELQRLADVKLAYKIATEYFASNPWYAMIWYKYGIAVAVAATVLLAAVLIAFVQYLVTWQVFATVLILFLVVIFKTVTAGLPLKSKLPDRKEWHYEPLSQWLSVVPSSWLKTSGQLGGWLWINYGLVLEVFRGDAKVTAFLKLVPHETNNQGSGIYLDVIILPTAEAPKVE